MGIDVVVIIIQNAIKCREPLFVQDPLLSWAQTGIFLVLPSSMSHNTYYVLITVSSGNVQKTGTHTHICNILELQRL